jgi:hypothetical protein
MVAQVDEQQVAMVALSVHPAREFNSLADIGFGKLRAGVCSVGVHTVPDTWFLIRIKPIMDVRTNAKH